MENVIPLLDIEQEKQIARLVTLDGNEAIRRRAKVILAYHTRLPTREVAREAGLSRGRARYWRRQFTIRGMGIFPPAPAEVPVRTPLPASLIIHTPELPLPEPYESPGIQTLDPMAEAGRKTLLYHFAEMLSHEAGTRLGEDIEQLHDMRVATRRMRAALDIFYQYYSPKAIKPHLKGLRATGRALGRVRDLDVFIEKSQRYLAGLPQSDRDGLQPLLETWSAEREALRIKLADYLDSKDYREFKERFNNFLQSPGKGIRRAQVEFPTPTLVKDVAPLLIYSQWVAVRAYEAILPSASLDQLHALRIEFKKLRYSVEFFKEVLGGQAKKIINTLKNIQDHLGDLNDARVACQKISDFLTVWETRLAQLPMAERFNPEPIVAYLAYQHSERHQLMLSFPKRWEEFNQPEFRDNLLLAVSVMWNTKESEK